MQNDLSGCGRRWTVPCWWCASTPLPRTGHTLSRLHYYPALRCKSLACALQAPACAASPTTWRGTRNAHHRPPRSQRCRRSPSAIAITCYRRMRSKLLHLLRVWLQQAVWGEMAGKIPSRLTGARRKAHRHLGRQGTLLTARPKVLARRNNLRSATGCGSDPPAPMLSARFSVSRAYPSHSNLMRTHSFSSLFPQSTRI